jgi:O-methyltransferase
MSLERLLKISYSYPATLMNTYESAINAVSVPGCYVECGVGAGAQIGAMCLALQDIKQTKEVIGFDSFIGIPMAGPNDETQPGIGPHKNNGELISSGIASHSVSNVITNLAKCGIYHPVKLIPGWFQDTVPQWKGEIALLRLDGDLYESTRVCLEHLLPQVVEGGIVIIDDYALPGCRKACDEFGIKGIPVKGGHGPIYFIK